MIIEEANRLNHVAEYYFSQKLAEIKQFEKTGANVINLGIGSPDMAPSPETINALCKSAAIDTNHGYQNYKGAIEFRNAIIVWYHKTYQVNLNPETEILPLIGSKEGIMHISMAFLNPGDKVLIPNPGYPTYHSVTKLVGGKAVFYNLKEENNWQIDLNELKKLDLNSIKLMWLNTPHMPTGTIVTDEIIHELIELAKKHKFLICCDNPYSLVLTDSCKSIFQFDGAKEVAIELNSLSKSHNMAGWRIGWLSAQKEIIDTILKVKSNMDSGMFLPLQHAAIEALNNSGKWHDRRNAIYLERKLKVMELFDYLNCAYDKKQVGMFLWAKAPETINNLEKFVDKLIYKAGVFITPGFIFGSNGSRYLRVSLCCKVELIEAAIQRIKKII